MSKTRTSPTKTLAIASHKGGTGKTVTTVSLAGALAEDGFTVLVVDLDGQRNATRRLGVDDRGGLLEAFVEGAPLEPLILPTVARGVDIVPSSRGMHKLDRQLVGVPGAEGILRELLAALPQRWDVVLVDTPPLAGFAVTNALTACSEVLVPVEMTEGLGDLQDTIKIVRQRLNPALRLAGILCCRVVGRHNFTKEVLTVLRETFGEEVFQTVIRENVRLKESATHRKPVTTYDPASHGAEDYRSLARELTKQWGWKRGKGGKGGHSS